MKKLIGTSLCSLFIFTGVFAQETDGRDPNAWCASERMTQQVFEQFPEIREAQYAAQLLENSRVDKPVVGPYNKAAIYKIPVVFHIIHQYGAENVNDSEVYIEMQIINDHFNANDPDSTLLVPEFQNLHANSDIEFYLAAIDPDGNCTNGIEHIYSHETLNGDNASKLQQWDRKHYLNIWIVDNIGVSGAAAYSHPPASTDGPGFWYDGVISNDAYVNGGDNVTLTHEIGHYLNLPHVFGSSDLIANGPTVCADDGFADTPVTRGHTTCPTGYPATWYDCTTNFIEDTDGTYTFDSITPTSGIIDPTPVPEPLIDQVDMIPGIIYSSFTANGVGTNPTTTGSFGFDGWDTGALDGELVYANLTGTINTAKYYEFTIIPGESEAMTIDNLKFDVARDAEGPRTYAVRWSEDGFASNMNLTAASSSNPNITAETTDNVFFYNQDAITMESGNTVSFAGSQFNSVSPVTFRIYGYNAEDATGDFIIDEVIVNGEYGIVEDVNNYMDYSFCNYHYSPDQVNAMRTSLIEIAGQRNQLILDSTLILTGVTGQTLPQTALTVPLCAPIADFDMRASNKSTRSVCVGEPITFEDHSYNAVITTRDWIFEDGTMAGSPTNPTVTFSTPGWKDVTLTVSNSAGSGTETRENYVYVSPLWGDFTGPKSINFEAGYSDWFLVNNFENNEAKFSLVSGAGVNGSNAMKLNNYKDVSNAQYVTNDWFYNMRLGNNRDELISPSYDLRNTSNVEVSFDYAYATNATQSANITEKLVIYSSTDCGKTWQMKTASVAGQVPPNQPGGIDDESLVTGGYAGYEDYTPSSSVEWRTATITYNATSADDHTRFKLEFIASDYSSNLYIDNFNVTGTLNLSSEEIALLDLNVYPNPTTSGSSINISYTAQEEPVTFTLRDTQGKIVASEVITTTNAMVNQTLKGSENLRSACYFLEVTTGDHSTTRKVVVL